MSKPRLRMFAGPNGSGKSTIKGVLPPELLGVYLNPDEIEKEIRDQGSGIRDQGSGIRDQGFLDVSAYGVATTAEEVLPFFVNSELLVQSGMAGEAARLRFAEGKIGFCDTTVNAYFASVAADFLRRKLLEKRVSFSFETVMSAPDKVVLLEKAQNLGYRTYLYYIATEDPAINVARVKGRVLSGGHDVPEDKIVSRYARSLDLLLAAVRHTNRTYLFDNSRQGGEKLFVAEITDGRELELKCDPMPSWFRYAVWDRIHTDGDF